MAKFDVGQKVIVVDDGKVCPTYYDWAIHNNLSMSVPKIREVWARYLSSDYNDCERGTFLTVVAIGFNHMLRDTTVYLCEDSNGNPVLIEEKGLDVLVEKIPLKWTDLKVGDVLRKKLVTYDGYRVAMVIEIDTYTTTKHVLVADEWLSDEELAGWEKVEE